MKINLSINDFYAVAQRKIIYNYKFILQGTSHWNYEIAPREKGTSIATPPWTSLFHFDQECKEHKATNDISKRP